MTAAIELLPGIPREHVIARLSKAGGNELESGKFANPQSSAALAVNTFGWFVPRPTLFPMFQGIPAVSPVLQVEVEYCARFPWSGGRHPYLDAAVETEDQLIGIESKRFEPYRDAKCAVLSAAYDRPVWGSNMYRFEAMRDALRQAPDRFTYLDAAQLVKHAFGLVTDSRRKAKSAWLVYLFAEPSSLGAGCAFDGFVRHRNEISVFAEAVRGDAVGFLALSYREWLASWPLTPASLTQHARLVVNRFDP